MSDTFDPYYKWLGIAPGEQRNYYRLLGLNLFESDTDVIDNLAEQKIVAVRNYQNKYQTEATKILNELSIARVTLLNPEKKKNYDQRLRRELDNNSISNPFSVNEPPVTTLPPTPEEYQQSQHNRTPVEEPPVTTRPPKPEEYQQSQQNRTSVDEPPVTTRPPKPEEYQQSQQNRPSVDEPPVTTRPPKQTKNHKKESSIINHLIEEPLNSNSSFQQEFSGIDYVFQDMSVIPIILKKIFSSPLGLIILLLGVLLWLSCLNNHEHHINSNNVTVSSVNEEQDNKTDNRTDLHETIRERIDRSRQKVEKELKEKAEAEARERIISEKKRKEAVQEKIFNDSRWLGIEKKYYFIYVDINKNIIDCSRLNIQLDNIASKTLDIEIISINKLLENSYSINKDDNKYSFMHKNHPLGFSIVINPPVIESSLSQKMHNPENFLDIVYDKEDIIKSADFLSFVNSCLLKLTYENSTSKQQETIIASFLQNEYDSRIIPAFNYSIYKKSDYIDDLPVKYNIHRILNDYVKPDVNKLSSVSKEENAQTTNRTDNNITFQTVRLSIPYQTFTIHNELFNLVINDNTDNISQISIDIKMNQTIKYIKKPILPLFNPKEKTIQINNTSIVVKLDEKDRIPSSISYVFTNENNREYFADEKEQILKNDLFLDFLRKIINKLDLKFDVYKTFPEIDGSYYIIKRIRANEE